MAPKRPFSDLDWQLTPEPVKVYIEYLERCVLELQKIAQDHEARFERLEARLGQNSRNSSRPPSSDSPFTKEKRKKPKSSRKKGGQKGHKGHRQQMLPADNTTLLYPEECSCGHQDLSGCDTQAFYTHQHIEIPEIPIDVTHITLHKCKCPGCGKTLKARLPRHLQTGYGPRLSAFVAELSGIEGMSRHDVSVFCQSVFGVPISTGAIQKIIDRASKALRPFYEHAGQLARGADHNYIDETSWFNENRLQWLWTMVNERVAYYRIDPNRSKKAFERLIEDWRGILISDSYGLYCSWVDKRQTCLAHLIRKAVAISEHKDREIKYFGHMTTAMLKRLTHFAKAPPSEKQWTEFYRQFLFSLGLYENDKNVAGRLARQILRELDCLWTFLDHKGIEPTNNRAERALRFGVLWRKRSFGSQSGKGCRWVERILTFKETCRLNAQATYPAMVNLLRSLFAGAQPNLAWL